MMTALHEQIDVLRRLNYHGANIANIKAVEELLK